MMTFQSQDLRGWTGKVESFTKLELPTIMPGNPRCITKTPRKQSLYKLLSKCIVKMEEQEKTCGSRRMWGFINLTQRLHVSCFVNTQISTQVYIEFQTFGPWSTRPALPLFLFFCVLHFTKQCTPLAQTHTKASADCRIINIHHLQTSVLHTSDAIQNTWNNNEPSV